MDITWTAKGTTDDVTICGHCGREDLKGTVRMVALDADGQEHGEEYMGTTCAANMTGRKAADIQREAKAADAARRDAEAAHRDARHVEEMAAGDYVLRTLGLERSFSSLKVLRQDPGYVARMAAWDQAHPRP